tara:strand:- start:307 stop:2757 length:2451 start_codon:yes stop_codon:yes gene_type:complete
MSKYLLIGIGSTGLSILEQAEQFIFDFTGKNKPGTHVESIYLETDLSRLPVRTASGKTAITQVPLSLGSNAVDIRQLKITDHVDSDWIPESTDVLKNLNGAGGMPSFGRLALWGGSNYTKFKSEVQKKYERISGDNETNIIVVGSLTGGTGSGLCIDVPYLVRDITKNSNVTAIFLLPDGKSFGENKTLHENSHSALVALDYFYKNTYDVTFPDNVTITDERAPFGLIQYISQDFSSAKASISSLDELIRVAGVTLGLNIIDTGRNQANFNEIIARRRVDSAGSGRIENAITSGFLMIQFPKAQLEELLSLDISSELLSDLINPTDYLDRLGNKKNILGDEVIIKNEVFVKAESIIKSYNDAFDSINTPKGITMKDSVEEDSQTLYKNTFEQLSGKRFLYDLFSSKSAGNYFEQINNNGSLVRDILVESFQDYIKQLTEEKKNLSVTLIGIESFKSYLEEVISFYNNSYSVTGDDSNWDGVLAKHIELLLSEMPTYRLALMSSSYSSYVLSHLLDLTKIHCSIQVLKVVISHLGNPETELLSTDSTILPNIRSVEKRISMIANLLNGDGDESNYTIRRRDNELIRSLDSFASCFKMVYRSGSRHADMKEAKSNYLKDDSQRITHSTLTGNTMIWDFFNERSNTAYAGLVSNAVKGIHNLNLFSNTSLESILKSAVNREDSNLSEIVRLLKSPVTSIRQQVPAMVKVKDGVYVFGDDACAKLILISSDHKKYASLFPECSFSPTSDNASDLPSLQNTIILYQEYGYMGDVSGESFNPLVHIGQMDDTKMYLSKVSQKENYLSRKVAYLSNEAYKKYL